MTDELLCVNSWCEKSYEHLDPCDPQTKVPMNEPLCQGFRWTQPGETRAPCWLPEGHDGECGFPRSTRTGAVMRTTYTVEVDHEEGEEPIFSVSTGARIVSVSFKGQ